MLPGHSDGIVGVKEPREIRHVPEDGETEVERDQLARVSLQQWLSRRESPNGQEVC